VRGAQVAETRSPLLLTRLRAVHHALDSAGFPHAVGGAIALAIHVREPRFTAHIDLNVTADPRDTASLLGCLPTEIDIHTKAEKELRDAGQTRVIWPDPSTPVDLFLPQHPTYHRMVVERAVPVDFLGVGIRVVTATDLMVFKMLFNRSKDWVDIEALLEAAAGDPDEARGWVVEFLGTEDARLTRLDRLLAEQAGHTA
jgi:hypothetical protein